MNAKVEEKLDIIQSKLLSRIEKVEKRAAKNSEKLGQHSKELGRHSKELGQQSKEIKSLQKKVRMEHPLERKENYFAKRKGRVYQFVDKKNNHSMQHILGSEDNIRDFVGHPLNQLIN